MAMRTTALNLALDIARLSSLSVPGKVLHVSLAHLVLNGHSATEFDLNRVPSYQPPDGVFN